MTHRSWVALNVIKAVSEFPTGLTTTTLLAMLELKWESYILNQYKGFHCNFSTIQMVYDDRSSLSHALELHVIDWIQLANSQIHRVTLGENFSQLTLDMYLQPKYNMWINYQHDPRFMKGRSLRLISSAKTTSVVRNDGSDIPRHYTVATIPPSQLILIMLTAADKRFVQKEFTDRVRDVGYRNDYCLWLKITIVENTAHISPTPSLNPDDGPRLTRVDIHLVDMSAEGTPFVLSLYDKQTQLATMVQRHDYVGLYHPGVSTRMTNTQRNQSEIVFELMKDTAIFLMPEKEAREAKLNKVNLVSGITLVESFDSNGKQPIMERDEEGFMDCSLYKSRIYINDLEPCMINVTLLGKVVAVAENNPYIREEDDKRMDRYAMKIADSTGTIDITLWEDVGRLSRRQVKQGQYVILSGLHTSNRSRTNDGYVWYVNGSTVCNTEIYNVSSLHGLLTSVDFRSVMPLWYAKEVNLDSFQLEAGFAFRFQAGLF
ncbi:hypothetical protein BDB01DRAFT_495453 [Pilobolus umbonatus]|nr:hypothetical protein BDB01DRAFT_495453 [Pilobolus umbonatus]